MSKQLGIYNKFCPNGGVLILRFGNNNKNRKQVYSLYIIHGSGGGRKEGAKAIRLADMASIVDTDIYIHSHTHLPMIMKNSYARLSYPNSSAQFVDKLFINTSAMLDYGGYGQKFGFKPGSQDTPIIYLNGTKRQITAKL